LVDAGSNPTAMQTWDGRIGCPETFTCHPVRDKIRRSAENSAAGHDPEPFQPLPTVHLPFHSQLQACMDEQQHRKTLA
jgi:hypothetical protein